MVCDAHKCRPVCVSIREATSMLWTAGWKVVGSTKNNPGSYTRHESSVVLLSQTIKFQVLAADIFWIGEQCPNSLSKCAMRCLSRIYWCYVCLALFLHTFVLKSLLSSFEEYSGSKWRSTSSTCNMSVIAAFTLRIWSPVLTLKDKCKWRTKCRCVCLV